MLKINGVEVSPKTYHKANVQALVVCMLASHIEGLAADLKLDDERQLAINIRQFANNETGESFGAVSDMFDDTIDCTRYDKRQLLSTLCVLIKRESEKLNQLYFSMDARASFQKHDLCVKLYQLHKNDFFNSNMAKEINYICVYFKEACRNI